MTSVASESSVWGWRRWLGIAVGGVVVHAALVFWLGERWRMPAPASHPTLALQLAVDDSFNHTAMQTATLSDPTLFALPSRDGFSGAAWLALVPAEIAEAAWTEPPRYLPIETNELGSVFINFISSNKPAGQVMEDVLKPRATTADILLLGEPVMTQSVVRLEGPVAQRPLLAPLRAPNPVHADVLPDTVVQFKINAAGGTESAILLAGCGAKTVDEQALAVAKAAQFQPLWAMARPQLGNAAEALSWGRMVFQWFTVPPSTANNVKPETE